jgi:signal transduction histidine kinase
VGEAASRLSGLWPAPAALLALARPATASPWPQIRTDPGATLLLFRHPSHLQATDPAPPLAARLHSADVLEEAARLVETLSGIDWDHAAARQVRAACLCYASAAEHLAVQTGLVDPDMAWAAGLLAPLGWLAVSAVDPAAVADCLADSQFSENPSATQARCWGLDQASIARRLALRWQLPLWLTAIAGHLGLAAETAVALGADPSLFRVAQVAIGLVDRRKRGLGLAIASSWIDEALRLGVSIDEEDHKALPLPASDNGARPPAPQALLSTPLLREFLYLAAENRRRANSPLLYRLEREVDVLHRAVQTQRAVEAGRLRAMNLETMAEFAAGAGHEINNPLAVISGQAQYLLAQEPEPSRQRALQTIVGQAQRIHDILTELMQFARPGRPQKRPFDLAGLIREAYVSLGGLAEQRRVKLLCHEVSTDLTVCADPRQAQIALTCLLRNAIEAAPADGWAGVRVVPASADRIDLLVEDSGPGPAPQQRPHLFDPFYSGRQAGRGRGLGLPTAWRLARENGGGVFFDEHSEGPTRFVLSLPRVKPLDDHPANGVLSANGHPDPLPTPS